MRNSIVSVALGVVLGGCGQAAVTVPPTASPTAASATAASAPAATSASGLPNSTPTTSPSAEPPASVALSVEGDAPLYIARRGTGLVALGAEHVWTSEDGVGWHASEISGLEGGTVVRLIDRSDGTLLAFGYAGNGRSRDSLRTWTSPDGRTWQAADTGLPADLIVFLDIGRGELGYLLVGRALVDDATPEQLWFSPDAETWELVYSTTDNESLAAVGAGPEGFVAVGQQGFRTGPPRAFVLASGDGRQWFEAAGGGVLADAGSLWSIVPLGGDWVTSPATVGTTLPVLWSANGLDWEKRASLPVEREDVGVIASLMSNGSRLYAAVADGGGRPVSSGLLTSVDATEWSLTSIPFAQSGLSVTWNFATAEGVDVFLVDGVLHIHGG